MIAGYSGTTGSSWFVCALLGFKREELHTGVGTGLGFLEAGRLAFMTCFPFFDCPGCKRCSKKSVRPSQNGDGLHLDTGTR
jgi:hypothetical protein